MMNQCEDKDSKFSFYEKHRECIIRIRNLVYIICVLPVVFLFLLRSFFFVKYTILSGSMLPTIQVGESVFISKLLYGWRIKALWSDRPDYFYRIHGTRDIVPGDIIVFNAPFGEYDLGKIRFNSDIKYCKRVLGSPGDRIGTVDGHCWNDKVLQPIGVLDEQKKLRWMFDSIFVWRQTYNVIPMEEKSWNIKNWGPLIVPQKGLTIELDSFLLNIYRPIIEYETGEELSNKVLEYTFDNNYYFVIGDNVIDSFDSRYWGFLPEDFVIGIVNRKDNRNKKKHTH